MVIDFLFWLAFNEREMLFTNTILLSSFQIASCLEKKTWIYWMYFHLNYVEEKIFFSFYFLRKPVSLWIYLKFSHIRKTIMCKTIYPTIPNSLPIFYTLYVLVCVVGGWKALCLLLQEAWRWHTQVGRPFLSVYRGRFTYLTSLLIKDTWQYKHLRIQ